MFKILNMIFLAALYLAKKLFFFMRKDIKHQDEYISISRGKGGKIPHRVSKNTMAIKRLSLKARNIKKHGR